MFVIKCLRSLWVFGVVVRLDSDNGCVVLHQVGISLYFMKKMHGQTTLTKTVSTALQQFLIKICFTLRRMLFSPSIQLPVLYNSFSYTLTEIMSCHLTSRKESLPSYTEHETRNSSSSSGA